MPGFLWTRIEDSNLKAKTTLLVLPSINTVPSSQSDTENLRSEHYFSSQTKTLLNTVNEPAKTEKNTERANDPVPESVLQQPLDLFRLDGRVAVVIGGTGVLCGAIARGLASAGATTILVGRNEKKAANLVGQIELSGHHADFIACDVTQPERVSAMRDHILEKHGHVEILLNGAGINSSTPFIEISDDEIERVVGANFKALFYACQVFGKYFVERSEQEGVGASVINVGSMSGIRPLSRVFTYSATKAAVHNLSGNLAREWGPYGVRVNTLVPGFFPAEQNRRVLTPDRIQRVLDGTPFGRFGEPQELIGAALLLASDAGRFITGAELVVDGGFAIHSI